MKSVKLLLLAGAFALFAVACATQPTTTVVTNQTVNSNKSANINPGANDELAEARDKYLAVCANCHKADGSGGTRDVDGGKMRIPDLRTDNKKKDPDSEFIEQIEQGGDGMPAFKGRLTDQQIKDIVRYIRRDIQNMPVSAATNENPPPANANAAANRRNIQPMPVQTEKGESSGRGEDAEKHGRGEKHDH